MGGDGRRSGRLYPRANRQGQPDRDGQDLGQRLSPDHDEHQAGSKARRFPRHEAARAGIPAMDVDVQGVGRVASLDQLQRGLFGATDQNCRRPGEPIGHHLDSEAL